MMPESRAQYDRGLVEAFAPLERQQQAEVIADLKSRLNTAQADAAGLREALNRYGRHEDGCQAHVDAATECDCGFTAAGAPAKE